MSPSRIVTIAAVVAAAGCRSASGQLGSENAVVRVSSQALAFGSVYVGAKPQLVLSIANSGGAPDTVTVGALAGGVFTAASGTFSLAGGASEGVAITFLPTQPGPAAATLEVSWTGGSTEVAITGTGIAQPACTPQGPCSAATFDPDTGVCSQTTQPDGTACSDSSGCLSGARCQAGQCLGTVASCDDGNACTADVCVIGQGCQNTPIVCPASNDPCQASSCDPVHGCVTNQVPDGTPCSSTESCQAATVCLAGACVGTSVPDGTPCSLGWAPCVADAACRSGTCDSPTADGYQPGDLLWSTASQLGAQGGLAVDGDGGLYFVAAITGSGATANSGKVIGLDQCGNTRWTSTVSVDSDVMLDGDQLVAFDASTPRLLGLDLASGGLLWQLSLAGALSSICPASDFGSNSGGQWGASLSAPVMSAQGQIFVAGNCETQSDGNQAFLLAVYRDGTVDWLTPSPYADAAPVLDSNGNIYLVTNKGGSSHSLSSFDASGKSRFAAVSYGGQSDVQLVVGTSSIVDIANGNAFSLSGGQQTLDLDNGPFSNAFYSSIQATGGAVDAAGNVDFAFNAGSGLAWGSVAPAGSLLWSLPFVSASGSGDDIASYPVLAADGTLFVVESEGQDNPEWQTTSPGTLLALDTGSGKQAWSKSVAGASSLALAPSGALLLTGASVQSVFAGKVQVSTTAPWSRYRGGNANRGAAFGQ